MPPPPAPVTVAYRSVHLQHIQLSAYPCASSAAFFESCDEDALQRTERSVLAPSSLAPSRVIHPALAVTTPCTYRVRDTRLCDAAHAEQQSRVPLCSSASPVREDLKAPWFSVQTLRDVHVGTTLEHRQAWCCQAFPLSSTLALPCPHAHGPSFPPPFG